MLHSSQADAVLVDAVWGSPREPASEPAPFEFEFEDEELQEEQLREKVWEEMLSFHGESSFGKGGGSGVTPMMS